MSSRNHRFLKGIYIWLRRYLSGNVNILKTEHLRNVVKMWVCCKVTSVNQYTISSARKASQRYFHCSKLVLNTHTLSLSLGFLGSHPFCLRTAVNSTIFGVSLSKQNLLLLLLGPLGKLLECAGKPEANDLVLMYIIMRKLYTDITSPGLCSTSDLASPSQQANIQSTLPQDSVDRQEIIKHCRKRKFVRSHYKTYRKYHLTCSSSLSNSSLLFLCRKTALDSSLSF